MECSVEYHLNTISQYEWGDNESDATSNSVYYLEFMCYPFLCLCATNKEIKFYCVKMHQ